MTRCTAPATYRSLFAQHEYRALAGADVVSQAGDQFAAVALAVLVYSRSGSALLAAAGYALAFVPMLVAGPLLAAVAERLPGRRVLVGADLARAVLVGLAALPATPLPLLVLLLLASAFLAPVFAAARASTARAALDDEHFALHISVGEVVYQTSQLVGFVVGGALTALLGAHGALGLNAASFAASALVLGLGVTARPAGNPVGGDGRTGLLAETLAGARTVACTPALRRPLLLAVAGGAYVIVPEAVAGPWAAELVLAGHAAVAGVALPLAGVTGLLMAAPAVGSVLGAVLVARYVPPAARLGLARPLALVGTVPLLAAGLPALLGGGVPGGLTGLLALLVLAGSCTAYNVPANAAYAAAVPDGARARAFGLANSALMAGQVSGILLGGLAAELLGPHAAVALAGAAGLLLLAPVRGLDEQPAGGAPALPVQVGPQSARDVLTAPYPDGAGTAGVRPARRRSSGAGAG